MAAIVKDREILRVHTYDSKERRWGIRELQNKDAKVALLEKHWHLPGEFNFDERVLIFRWAADRFEKTGLYCDYVEGSFDYIDFWDTEKSRCYGGVLVDDTYYITGDEYWYLNYIKIYDKVKQNYDFPRFQDLDVWAYYEMEFGDLLHEFLGVLKARQSGFTLKFSARILKRFWFEAAFASKILAYEDKYVLPIFSDTLTAYRAHLNEHTGWPRHFDLSDSKVFWKEGFKERIDGKEKTFGNLSSIKGMTTHVKPSSVVSGGLTEVFYDEAGVSLNLGKVFQLLSPTMKFGDVRTGNFWMSGAAGETSESGDLAEIIKNPASYLCRVFNVPSWSREGRLGTGMFVPYYYSYGSFIDAYGNSLIDEAKAHYALEEEAERQKGYEKYAMFKAQYPEFIEDAFSSQSENMFGPEVMEITQKWLDKLEQMPRPVCVKLEYDKSRPTGISHVFDKDIRPVETLDFRKGDNREGAVEVVEFPSLNPEFGLYYAAVDPIRTINTKDKRASLLSIYIYKAAHRIENEFSEEKLVAWYAGRHANVHKTFEIAKKLIMWYNARAAIENDQASFVEWMQKEKMHRHLMRRADMPILNDIVLKSTIDTSEYGFRTGSGKLKEYFYSLIGEFVTEEIGETFDAAGDPVTRYGVERISDRMVLKEILSFTKDGNFDRLIAFGGVLMVARANTNRGIMVVKKSNRPNSGVYSEKGGQFRHEPAQTKRNVGNPILNQRRSGKSRKLPNALTKR